MNEHQWRRYIRAIFRKAGISSEDAEDLCQEVVLAYWEVRKVTPWEDTSPQKSLVGHLARAQLSRWFERVRKEKAVSDHYSLKVQNLQQTSDIWRSVLLSDALHRLPSLHRKIIEMKVLQGASFREIGEQLSCSANTAKSCYYRAVAQIRKYFAESATISMEKSIYCIETEQEVTGNAVQEVSGTPNLGSSDCGGGDNPADGLGDNAPRFYSPE